LAAQTKDKELQACFAKLAQQLGENEENQSRAA
jgi:monomeric isocitrate dehydrogenase